MSSDIKKPLMLIILDGWGESTDTNHNAIYAANTPFWDQLQQKCAKTVVSASGTDVGLPAQQMGNSEVGHTNLGAGRTVYQDLVRINNSIADGSFFKNEVLLSALDVAVNSNLHVMGLLSDGGIHSHQQHLVALLQLAATKKIKQVYIHVFLDGRDTPPKKSIEFLQQLQQSCNEIGVGRIATVSGRFYAMDRDHRWERIAVAYNAMVNPDACKYKSDSAIAAVEQAYARGETDEFVEPTVIATAGETCALNNNDVIINFNFRADRVRQLSHALLDKDFSFFKRDKVVKLQQYVTFTEYEKDLTPTIVFPPQQLKNIFAEYIAAHGLKQLRVAETEKYPHVTFFFNGGMELPFAGEDRQIIASPKVKTYDLKPEMSAYEVADTLVAAIKTNKYDVIICNFANADMVGHTGNFDATVAAIEALDKCLQQVITALQQVGGEALITADHGNAEKMYDGSSGQAHTAHTNLQVPLIYVGRKANLKRNGTLTDIAPTLLHLLNLKQPPEMTGKNLIEFL